MMTEHSPHAKVGRLRGSCFQSSRLQDGTIAGQQKGRETIQWRKGLSLEGSGPLGWFRNWVTAHPNVDPNTKELILYHNTFSPPFVNYSIVPSPYACATSDKPSCPTCILNRPIPGTASAKIMHDFGVSRAYTAILNLPLSFLNLLKNRCVIDYNPKGRSHFGVFPRYRPQDIRWARDQSLLHLPHCQYLADGGDEVGQHA